MPRKIGAVAVLSLAAVLGFSACSAPEPEPVPTETGTAEAPVIAGTTLVVAAESGTKGEGYKNVIIPLFEEATGVNVEYVELTSFAQFLAQLESTNGDAGVDWFGGNALLQAQGAENDLWQEQLLDLIPNRELIDERLQNDDVYGVPISATIGALEYNTQVFDENGWDAPTSLDDLRDPKYAGHVGLYEPSIALSAAWIAQMSKLAGGDESDTAAGFKQIAKIKPNIYQLFPNATPFDQGFVQGNVWLGINTTQRIQLLRTQGGAVDVAAPEEGVIYLPSVALIPSGSKNPEAAAAFTNFMLSPEIQDLLPDRLGAGPVIDGVTIPADIKRFYPPIDDNTFLADWTLIAENLPAYVEDWNRTFS